MYMALSQGKSIFHNITPRLLHFHNTKGIPLVNLRISQYRCQLPHLKARPLDNLSKVLRLSHPRVGSVHPGRLPLIRQHCRQNGRPLIDQYLAIHQAHQLLQVQKTLVQLVRGHPHQPLKLPYPQKVLQKAVLTIKPVLTIILENRKRRHCKSTHRLKRVGEADLEVVLLKLTKDELVAQHLLY